MVLNDATRFTSGGLFNIDHSDQMAAGCNRFVGKGLPLHPGLSIDLRLFRRAGSRERIVAP